MSDSTVAESPNRSTGSSSRVTDEKVLLNLLQEEVDRSKMSERSYQHTAEMKERDEMRSAVMLRLAQEQIEMLKTDNRRMAARIEAGDKDLTESRASCTRKDQEYKSLQEDFQMHLKKSKDSESQSQSDISRVNTDYENAQGSLNRLQVELEETKVALRQLERQAETERRTSFETKVSLETKLKSKEEEQWFLEDLRAKETKTATTREYDLSQQIVKLQKEIKMFRSETDDYKRATTESHTSMTTENEQLKLKLATVEGMTKSTDRDNFEKIQRLSHELTMLRERAEQDQLSAKAREKAQEAQICKLITDLKSAQGDVNALADKEVGSNKGHVDTIIQLSAQRDSMKLRVDSLEQDNEHLRKELHAKKVELGAYKEEMNKKLALASRKHDSSMAQRSDEISKLTYELTAMSSKQLALQEELDNLKHTATVEKKTHAADVASLRAEVEGYKKSVEQLEKHIKENYTQKALEEQNNSLKAQNTHLKSQVSATNSALANLRVEADVSEGYRIKLMQEEVELQLTRVNALEKERRFARPLIQDLVEVVNKEDLADPALARDMDMFFRQFGMGTAKP